jgi:transcription antitermination factor NusG
MIEPSQEKFEPGEKVKIISGPLNGFEGELLTINRKSNLIIRLDAIGYTLKIEISQAQVIKL